MRAIHGGITETEFLMTRIGDFRKFSKVDDK